MKIETAVFDDLPEIATLQKLAFYQVGAFYSNFRIRPLLATLDDFERTFWGYHYLKATLGTRIVGSARAKVIEGVCKIENVIVHPAHQRQGIGKSLVGEIIDLFPEAHLFELFTGKDSPGNVDFYTRLGFLIVKETPATENEPVLVVMEKRTL